MKTTIFIVSIILLCSVYIIILFWPSKKRHSIKLSDYINPEEIRGVLDYGQSELTKEEKENLINTGKL